MWAEPRPAKVPAASGAVRPRAAVPALLLLLLLPLALLAPTAAQAQEGDSDTESSPTVRIAEGLRTSPVYVDPLYESAFGAVQQAELAERIEETGLPITVVLVPLVDGDSWNGDEDVLASTVHDRMELNLGEPLVMITPSSTWGLRHLTGHEWPDNQYQAGDAARAVGFGEMREVPLAGRLASFVDLVESGTGEQAYQDAVADLSDGSSSGGGSADEDGGGGLPGWLGVLLVVVPLLAVGVSGWLVWRRRGGDGEYSAPRTVLTVAREAEESGLRERARVEVVEFGEELTGVQNRNSVPPERLRKALDAYSAAGTVLDRARSVPDLAGVLAILAEGRAALSSSGEKGRRLCFFNPLHGTAGQRVRWRPLGRADTLRVHACGACGKALRSHLPPEVLTDSHEGRDVPYFEVPAEHSLWAATGYGALGEDSLTARVRRGDFTRTLD